MARGLSTALNAAMLHEKRQPDYIIEIYDIRSTSGEITPTQINDVVIFNAVGTTSLPAIVGPRDFSEECEWINLNEVAGDYANNGVAASQITFRIVDQGGFFDPLGNPAPEDGRWMRQGNVVVIREGDASVTSDDWPITFTGTIVGQPGREEDRASAAAFLTAKANSREADFLRRNNTTRNYPQNSTYQDIAEDIAEVDMGLDLDEINFPTFGTTLTQFLTTQFLEESPLVSIAKIMFIDGYMPRFEGDGRLGLTDGSITKAPARVYPEAKQQIRIIRPIVKQDGINEVTIKGLDADMSQVIQQRQLLANASITTGFFSDDVTIPVSWSQDKTQQALDVRMEVDTSVADGIFNFGGESFTEFTQSDGGSLEGEIDVDGALATSIVLASIVAGIWIGSHKIPDNVIVFGVGASEGITLPIGRPIEGVVGKLLFSILGKVGNGQYRITGRPYEYIFQEIVSVARISGIRSEDRKGMVIENHLLNTQSDCDDVAERVLRQERAKQNQRTISMIHDLKVEPDDIIEVGTGLAARRYFIQNISRRLFRGPGAGTAQLNGFEVTSGVRP